MELSRMREGVPCRQRLETHLGHMHDNFYLMRLVVVKDDHRSTKTGFYLFTTKEINTAVNRYKYDLMEVPFPTNMQLLGYSYPVSYHNRNGILTYRHLLKFSGHGVVGLNNEREVCGLFSDREMRRAKERVDTYVQPSIWKRMWKGLKRAIYEIFRLMSLGVN